MPTRYVIEATFQRIVRAAVAGERCPKNCGFDDPSGLPNGTVVGLVKDGRIRVEVYAHNYRVIQILSGPHAGRRTAEPPNKDWRPYKVLPTKRA